MRQNLALCLSADFDMVRRRHMRARPIALHSNTESPCTIWYFFFKEKVMLCKTVLFEYIILEARAFQKKIKLFLQPGRFAWMFYGQNESMKNFLSQIHSFIWRLRICLASLLPIRYVGKLGRFWASIWSCGFGCNFGFWSVGYRDNLTRSPSKSEWVWKALACPIFFNMKIENKYMHFFSGKFKKEMMMCQIIRPKYAYKN